MSSNNPAATLDTMNGAAKTVYGGVNDLVPPVGLKLLNMVKYDRDNEVGLQFSEMVWLTGEHGFTAGGTGSAEITLNEPETAESQPTVLQPNAIHMRSAVTIETMSRVADRGVKAMEPAVESLLRNQRNSFNKRLEWTTRNGGQPLATMAASTAVTTTLTAIITRDSWCAGPWIGSKNMSVDAYDSATQLNTRADLKVETIGVATSTSTRTVVMTGNADDITAILAIGTNGSGVNLYYKGWYGNDGVGLRGVANLSSGSYLGITSTDYPDVWSGSQVSWSPSYNSGGTEFSWRLLQTGLEQAADRGLEGDVCVEVPNHVWSDLNSSLDALRTFDSSYQVSKAENGRAVDGISYNAITGHCKIYASRYINDGDVLVYPDPSDSAESFVTARRMGSTDITTTYPGAEAGRMFKMRENKNSVEYRSFSDQQFYLPAPRQCVIFT